MNFIFDLPMNSTSNPPSNSTDDTPTACSVLSAIVLLVLSVAIAIANILVIVIIWKDPYKEHKRNSANYLILNLAICDLLTGVPGMLLRGLICLFPPNYTLFVAENTSLHITLSVSCLTIVSLAVERLIVVSYPLRNVDYLTTRRITVWIISIWALVALHVFCVPRRIWRKYYFTIFAIIGDVVGVMTMILLPACYIKIYILVRKTLYLDITTAEERRTEGQGLTENARRMERLKKKERKVLLTVVLLTGIYLACWIPECVFYNLNRSCSCFKYPFAQDLILCLHSLLDPLCYSLCTAKFRRALLKIWRAVFSHNQFNEYRR